MDSTSVISGSNQDLNANFMGRGHYYSKTMIDLECMFEKADSSQDKFVELGGQSTSEERDVAGQLFPFGESSVADSNSSTANLGSRDSILDVFGDFDNLFDKTTSSQANKEEKTQNISTTSYSQVSKNIPTDKIIGSGSDYCEGSCQSIKDSKRKVSFENDLFQVEMKRSLSGYNESKSRLSTVQEEQSESSSSQISQEKENGFQKVNRNMTTMREKQIPGPDVVVPINSTTLYEELRRAIKEGNRLKKNNQEYELRNLELQGEVLDMSRMAAHFEAKSERGSTREEELKNELNAAIKRATQSHKEADICKKKVSLLEGLFVESEKRQSSIKKKLEEAENRMKTLEQMNEELEEKLKESTTTQENADEAIVETETANEVELEHEEKQEQKYRDVKEETLEQPHAGDCNRCGEYEDNEFRYLITALKQQLDEANAINKRYSQQVKHQIMSIERLKMENKKLQSDIKGMKDNDKGRNSKAFVYLQQYRDTQVQMQRMQSELKNARADKDDLGIQCKWMKVEIERLKSALASKSPKEAQEDLTDSQRRNMREGGKNIHEATDLTEERIRLARGMFKDSKFHDLKSQEIEEEKVDSGENSFNIAFGDRNQYSTLKDQHEKLSIEMALTRNTVKKLESDNSELRQQISLLKAEMALSFDGVQKEDIGGVIPGKYRRGNFEVVSRPRNGERERKKSRRTQSMSGFQELTNDAGNFPQYDKAQSLIDLTKVSIDEIDERRSSLKKHSSEGEKIYEYPENDAGIDHDGSRSVQVSKAMRTDGESKTVTLDGSLKSITRPMQEHHTHRTLRSVVSFPHTDEVSNFGNFKKIESTSKGYHVFKVPGALRASPEAKSLNSIVNGSRENSREHGNENKQRFNEHDYSYVAT